MDTRRRRLLQSLGVGFVAFAGCSDSPTDDDGTDSTPTGTGNGGATATATPTPEAGPERASWHVETGPVVNRPVVADDVTYVGTGGLYTENSTSSLLAVESDGSVRWRERLPGQMAAVHRVLDGTVYAFSGSMAGAHGDDFRLHAFDVADGNQRWVWAPDIAMTSFEFVGVAGDAVFVGTRDDARGAEGETLYAIDRSRGSVRWQVESGDAIGGTVVGDSVLVEVYGQVQAFAAADGTRRWTFEHGGYSGIESTAFDRLALVGDETLHAIDPVTGDEQWTWGDSHRVTSWLAGDETVYVGGDRVAALDRSGTELWSADESGHLHTALLSPDTLYGTGDAALFALERESGSRRWRIETDVEYPHLGALVDSRLAAGSNAGTLAVFDAATGRHEWSWKPAAPVTQPVVAADRIVVGSEGGGLFGLRP